MVHKKHQGKRAKKSSQQNYFLQLDKFSQEDLRTWQRIAKGLDEYHIRLYYHLEGLRNTHHEALCESIQNVPPTSIELEGWVRIVDYQYTLEPLSAAGSLVKGGRFNIGRDLNPRHFPQYPALYIADSYETAYAEKFGLYPSESSSGLTGHEFALRKPDSFTVANMNGNLDNLFDIRKTSNLKRFTNIIKKFDIPIELKVLAAQLGIEAPFKVNDASLLKRTILSADWHAWPIQLEIPANSQIFGRLIMEAGFEGVIYPSVKSRGTCVAIFPSNLAGTASHIELSGRLPKEVKYKSLDSRTWENLIG